VAGKVDWLVERRPVDGTRADEPTVGGLAKDDAVTCRPSDLVGDVGRGVANSPYPFALVLSAGRVVLGRVAASDLQAADADRSVDRIMDPGPKTVRPHKTAEGVAQDLTNRGLNWAIVTTPEGELIGVVGRGVLEAAITGG
jgi:predicted transcriptional regulator